MLGIILFSSRPFSSATLAISRAAVMHISSLIIFALTSRVPRNMAGNPMELFTWFGKSERPVATIFAPASFASQGQISGIGLAQAKTMESVFMLSTRSADTTPGPGVDIANSASAPLIAFSNPPVLPSRFVLRAISHLALKSSLRSVLSLLKIPLLSTIMMFPGFTPASTIILATAMLAAPAPNMQIIESFIFFPTIFNAFIKPAHHRPGTLLIIMPDRYSHIIPQYIKNIETLGLRDVFQIYSAKGRLQPPYRILYFFRNLSSETNRIRVHASQIFEQKALAFHHRQTSLRPNITKP